MSARALDKERHLQYWRRCFQSLLPTRYTENDSSRMTFGFFILSALDLLHEGSSPISNVEKSNIRTWILHCQHPHGGFCGSPNHRFPDDYYVDHAQQGEQEVDPANLPATFFAILSLGFVGDLKGVARIKCLRWLGRLQRDDGSFGELITPEGKIWGGRDMRYCYVATAIWWLLKGDEEETKQIIDVEKLVHHIRSGQTYAGGISESSQHEAHAGYTYCAIAALSFLDRLSNSTETPRDQMLGLTNIPEIIHWLVSRQVSYQDEEDEEKEEKEEPTIKPHCEILNFDGMSLKDISESNQFIGFNGRCNKKVDTCYAFWVTASLDLLGEGKTGLLDHLAARRFLLEQTQHRIGGFGKCPGDPPDIYHSYLGLAALATMKEPGIKQLDSALCVSVEHRIRMAQLRDDAVAPIHRYWKHGYCFWIREDDPDYIK